MKTQRWTFLLMLFGGLLAQAQFKQPYVWNQSVEGNQLTVEVVIPAAAYLYVDHKQTIDLTFTQADLPKLQAHFDEEFKKVNNDEKFTPIVNRYCMFCSATKDQCPFSKQL